MAELFWDIARFAEPLAAVRHAQGLLLGRMVTLGFPVQAHSMSSQIERERKEYYRVLEYTQKGSLDITSWLGWFVDCLGRAIAVADDTLASVVRRNQIWSLAGACKLNDRQRTVINRLLGDFKGKLTSSKYAKLAKCSPDTALRDIKELLEYGLLEKGEGGGRSTSYALAAVDSMRETAKDITE